MPLIKKGQKLYLQAHPLALWFSISIGVIGFLTLVFTLFIPSLVPPSSTSILLPEWLRLVFDAIWWIGGVLSTGGILRARRGIEAAGMMLIASGLLVTFLAVCVLSINLLPTSLFILGLAIGCGQRALFLANNKDAYLR